MAKWHLADRTDGFTLIPALLRHGNGDASFIWGRWIWRNWTIGSLAQEIMAAIRAQIIAQKGGQQ